MRKMQKHKIITRYLSVQSAMIAFVLICLASIASKSSIWFDESFTINLVRKPLPELIRLTALDVHPPLYYLVVKCFTTLLGESSFSLYLTSVLCYGALLLATAVFFHRFFSPEISLLITSAFCAVPNMLRYAVQLRMYSMAVLFVTLSFYLVYIISSYLEQTSRQAGKQKLYLCLGLLALTNTLAAYTHYFAGLAAVGISFFLLFIFLRRKAGRRRLFLIWCIYCGTMFILYLPWIPTLFGQMAAIDGNYWIEAITEATVHSYPAMLFDMPSEWCRELLTAVYLMGFFSFLLRFTPERQNIWALGCYGVAVFWLASALGYSIFRTPILHDRYLVILLPLLWIPVLLGCAQSSFKYVPVLVLLLFTLCFIQNYEDLYEQYADSYQNELKDYIDVYASGDDIFFHFYIQDLSVCEAYFPEQEQYMLYGIDAGQAFHYWPDLTGCHVLDSTEELYDHTSNIWCLNGSYLAQFEDMGFAIETISLDSQEIYRIYRP